MSSAPRYKITCDSPGSFSLYEDGVFLAKFTRSTFREELTKLCRSSNWVGAILRIFLKRYPSPVDWVERRALDRAIDNYKETGLAEYLRSKGFRVTKLINNVTDEEVITLLESKGYVIEGLLHGAYYCTSSNNLSQSPKKDLKSVNSG